MSKYNHMIIMKNPKSYYYQSNYRILVLFFIDTRTLNNTQIN